MNDTAKRSILRWIHIVFSIPIIGYVYSPFSDLPEYAPIVRFVSVPVLIFSGYWMYTGLIFGLIGVALWLGTNYLFGYGIAILVQIALFIARKIWMVMQARRAA